MAESMPRTDTKFYKFAAFLVDVIEKPIIWFRESLVLPNRQTYPWYHEQVRKVPTVDECYTDDAVCIFEADQQFKRDRLIDSNIVWILATRYEYCAAHNGLEKKEVCRPLLAEFQRAKINFFIKYGELGYTASARKAYMKQKHRMIWERRHGPVGSKKVEEENAD